MNNGYNLVRCVCRAGYSGMFDYTKTEKKSTFSFYGLSRNNEIGLQTKQFTNSTNLRLILKNHFNLTTRTSQITLIKLLNPKVEFYSTINPTCTKYTELLKMSALPDLSS